MAFWWPTRRSTACPVWIFRFLDKQHLCGIGIPRHQCEFQGGRGIFKSGLKIMEASPGASCCVVPDGLLDFLCEPAKLRRMNSPGITIISWSNHRTGESYPCTKSKRCTSSVQCCSIEGLIVMLPRSHLEETRRHQCWYYLDAFLFLIHFRRRTT